MSLNHLTRETVIHPSGTPPSMSPACELGFSARSSRLDVPAALQPFVLELRNRQGAARIVATGPASRSPSVALGPRR